MMARVNTQLVIRLVILGLITVLLQLMFFAQVPIATTAFTAALPSTSLMPRNRRSWCQAFNLSGPHKCHKTV